MHYDSRLNWLFSHKAALIALILIGFLLVIDHWNHIVTALPYLLLLACPIMHLFMHGDHSTHYDHQHGKGETKPKQEN